jgi:hypothetical protein
MRRLALFLIVSAATCAAWIVPATASATFTQCPPVFNDAGCGFLIQVTNGGVSITQDATLGPYDGSDDTLVGITNESSKTISQLSLSSAEDIFGFDGDGECDPGAAPVPPGCVVLPEGAFVNEKGEREKNVNAGKECGYEGEVKNGKTLTETIEGDCGFMPPPGEPAGLVYPETVEPIGFANGDAIGGYEGPRTWFSSIGAENTTGIVNFGPALAPGESTYFSLENALTGTSLVFGNATTLGSTLSGGGASGASITVVQGTPVTDTASLTGPSAALATGMAKYTVYSDPACTVVAAQAGEGAFSGATAAASSPVSLGPGKYYWRVSFGGDVNNQKAETACGSEVLTVLAPTKTATEQTAAPQKGASLTVPSGTAVSDKATIAGALAATATGSVTYTLYKNSTCTIAAGASSVGAVTAGVAAASTAVKPAVGTYYWGASYSGDGANAPSASTCGSEVLKVALKASLGLPSSKMCLSKRKFVVHPRAPKGVKLTHIEVFINGVLKAQGPLSKDHTTISLVGLPKGTYQVEMVVTSSKGKLYEDVRTFHTCVPKKHHKG